MLRKPYLTAVVLAAALLPAGAAQASYQEKPKPLPQLAPIKHGELKWILPPGVSSQDVPFYNGYPTVDHDDLTYNPGPQRP